LIFGSNIEDFLLSKEEFDDVVDEYKDVSQLENTNKC
jgi:hypothetical protein